MNERRDWLKQTAALSVGLSAGLALGGEAVAQPAAPKPAGPKPWQNWSGIQQCQARQWLMPADEAQLAEAIAGAPGPLRCVGAGHSFSALVPTDGTLISLDKLTGIIAIDKATSTVRVRAGTRLAQLARELHGQGLALHNQPDIDVQTLAGALATGTHGTGLTLPALHDEVQALRLVTPAGEVKEASRLLNPELFDAARVSLGSLGVITEYTLRVRPRHMLARRVWLEPTAGLLEKAPELARQHRHFEMYVLPFTGYSAGITHSEVAEGPAQHPGSADENVLRDLQRLRDWLGRWPDLRRWTAAKLIDPAQTEFAQDWSWRLLSTVRPTRFNESEYHLPREAGIACLKDILATLERRNDIFFPIEFRFIRGDGAWLSPFHGRDSCSVATHALQGEAYQYLIAELGPVFKRHGGRPHWGKLHDLNLKDLRTLYPRFADFQRVRESVDPQGRMLNAHLRQLFVGAANA
nr:D-arabinono-1,4-lactone oxidase [uncultured Roseateles sp.]